MWDSIFSSAGKKYKKVRKDENRVLTTGNGFGILSECPSGDAVELEKILRKTKKSLDKQLREC